MEIVLRTGFQEEGFTKYCEGLTCYDYSHDPSPHMIVPSFSWTSNGEKYKSVECCFCGQHKREEWRMEFV